MQEVDRQQSQTSRSGKLVAQSIADEYSGSEPTERVKLNGKLTLGENTADNSGLRIALMALESTLSQKPSHTDSNELTPQQEFFISYAETWCANATPQYLSMMTQSNRHANRTGPREWCGIQHATDCGTRRREDNFQASSVASESEYLGRKRFIAAANASAAARITSKEV